MQKRWHYLYVIVYPALGYKRYYGSRVCDEAPVDDAQYFGSSATFARYNDPEHADYQADALKVVLWAKRQTYGRRSARSLSRREGELIKAALEQDGPELCLNRNIAGRIYLTPEERQQAQQRSQANGGGFVNMPPDVRQKWAGAGGKKAARLKKGVHGLTPEQLQAARAKGNATISQKYAKTYTFCTPYGRNVTITNLAEFCRLHHLNPAHMRSLHSGRLKSHKGWRQPDDSCSTKSPPRT